MIKYELVINKVHLIKKYATSQRYKNFILHRSALLRWSSFTKAKRFRITQKAMTQLFGVEVPAISKHLANIYETNELQKESTISILEIVQN